MVYGRGGREAPSQGEGAGAYASPRCARETTLSQPDSAKGRRVLPRAQQASEPLLLGLQAQTQSSPHWAAKPPGRCAQCFRSGPVTFPFYPFNFQPAPPTPAASTAARRSTAAPGSRGLRHWTGYTIREDSRAGHKFEVQNQPRD